jgi:HrpA-like RNA helicase
MQRGSKSTATPAKAHLTVITDNITPTPPAYVIPLPSYVVDAGRAKHKLLDAAGSAAVSRYEVGWISKAAAEQRAGRAGRTCPGQVYRLYSSAHYGNAFPEHTAPEIAATPLEGVVLQLKALGVDRVCAAAAPAAAASVFPVAVGVKHLQLNMRMCVLSAAQSRVNAHKLCSACWAIICNKHSSVL